MTSPLSGRYRRQKPSLILIGLVSLYLLFLASWSPLLANDSPVFALSFLRPTIQIHQQGEIEYANVTLDGHTLFPVTASVGSANQQTYASTLRLRVASIESNLNRVVNQNIDPADLYVTVASLGKQTVILAGTQDQSTQETLLTVTHLDAQLAQETVPDLAVRWNDIILQALRQAWKVRTPQARQSQILQAAGIFMVLMTSSLGLSAIRRRIYQLFKRRKQEMNQHFLATNSSLPLTQSAGDAAEAVYNWQRKFDQNHQQRFNIWLRRLLQLAQMGFWIFGFSSLLLVFPETSLLGKVLLGIIVKLGVLAVLMLLSVQICRFFLHQLLEKWVEEASLELNQAQRVALRAPLLTGLLDGIITFAGWIIGLILFIDWQQTPIEAILANLGLFGVAVSIVFQNLLRDWMNGLFIIFGDQYAIGDTVNISGIVGVVESMNLRSTVIRGPAGSLNTIPHSQITTVQNLTKDWSRVDLTIQIANDTDVTQAMQVMQNVADTMAHEPYWQDKILDPASRMGVSEIRATGTEILMWIKTTRAAQWEVEHEFRYRLKLAFDTQGIHMS